MNPGSLHVPGTIIFGGGCRREAGGVLLRHDVRRPLIVTDPGVVRLGIVDDVLDSCRHSGLAPVVFAGVQADPTDQNVQEGLDLLKAERCDALVAVGGGSPLDTAKAISILATNAEPLAHYAGYHKISRPGLPLLAIPTTAGTGSEATKVAVITDTQRDVKMMILSAHLTPTAALVDYETTLTMPKPLTAAVGVDTLTHGIEAYVSRKAHGLTDPLALSCIDLVSRYLRRAFADPNDHEARSGMMLAACQGGMAFANASVCLVHGMSRPVGAVYHLPHGLSNAVLLPAVTRFSLAAAPVRYAEIARRLGFCPATASDLEAAECLPAGLQQLNQTLEIPRLGECLGVDHVVFEATLSKMASDALASGSPQNNPRVPTADEIVELYREAF